MKTWFIILTGVLLSLVSCTGNSDSDVGICSDPMIEAAKNRVFAFNRSDASYDAFNNGQFLYESISVIDGPALPGNFAYSSLLPQYVYLTSKEAVCDAHFERTLGNSEPMGLDYSVRYNDAFFRNYDLFYLECVGCTYNLWAASVVIEGKRVCLSFYYSKCGWFDNVCEYGLFYPVSKGFLASDQYYDISVRGIQVATPPLGCKVI